MKEGVQKIKIAKLKLAESILAKEVGSNLETVNYFSEKFNISLGTIQKALLNLTEEGVVSLKKRGKLGTVVENIFYSKLFSTLGLKHLLCVMPTTYSERYKSILTKVESSLQVELPVYFAHMRGGAVRLSLIEEGVFDFGIVSKLAAIDAIQSGYAIEILEEFGPETYVTKHVILKGKNKNISKIGVDYSSNDHIALTNANFQKNEKIDFVSISYSEVIERLIEGAIDAAIWNYDDVLDKVVHLENHGLEIVELKANPINLLATEMVIVTKSNNEIVKNIFNKFFNKINFDKREK